MGVFVLLFIIRLSTAFPYKIHHCRLHLGHLCRGSRTAYFEVFYAWARVQLQSVLGNVLKEIYPRLFLFLLLIAFTFSNCHLINSSSP
ncbi:MAG: hypothetical protein CM15mP83_9210 [Flavobacteriaceae bacterium]|nr:MAG: hypothetical protein CM15mP83_9210 [Flavobacteriaceae bacterium]